MVDLISKPRALFYYAVWLPLNYDKYHNVEKIKNISLMFQISALLLLVMLLLFM